MDEHPELQNALNTLNTSAIEVKSNEIESTILKEAQAQLQAAQINGASAAVLRAAGFQIAQSRKTANSTYFQQRHRR